MNDDVRNKINEYSTNDVGTFIDNYRTALEEKKTADINALNNQRNLDYTTIMSNANVKGMLHSNFPTRAKLRYDVQTYEPNLVKVNQSYQTGIDTLYNNAAKYLNQIKSLREQTADANATNTSTTTTASTGANANYTKENGYQFTDDQGNPITYYTWASRQGDDTAAISYLKEMADNGDANAKHAIAGLMNTDNGADQYGNLTAEEIAALRTLGWSNDELGKFGTRE